MFFYLNIYFVSVENLQDIIKKILYNIHTYIYNLEFIIYYIFFAFSHKIRQRYTQDLFLYNFKNISLLTKVCIFNTMFNVTYVSVGINLNLLFLYM